MENRRRDRHRQSSQQQKNLRNTFPYPYSLENAEWFVNDCILNEGKNQITRAIVVDQKAVGSIGIFIKDDVYEKSGFTYEGTMRNGVFKNGRIYSYCMYSILRGEME